MRSDGVSDEHMDEVMENIEEIMKWEDQKENNTCGLTNKQIAGKITRCNNNIKRIEKQYQDVEINIKEKVERIIRAKKVKVKPNKDQKDVLDQWFGAARFVYNQCISHHKETGISGNKTDMLRIYRDHIREHVMKKEGNEWLTMIHSVIVDDAITDFVKAFHTNIAKLVKKQKKGETFTFKMQFRSKRYMLQETIYCNARDWKKEDGAFSFLRKLKSSESLPVKQEARVCVHKTRSNEYYLSIVSEKSINDDTPRYEVIALDPGVRTFQTGFDVNGVTVEWGWNDMKNVFKRLKYADELQGKFTKETKSHKKKRQRLAWLKMLRKIKNQISDLHKRMVLFLCRCYKYILLPEFGSKKMSSKTSRKIGKTSVRSMLTWSHYRFRELLKAKVATFSKCTLIICDEHYTSKTCGCCGEINNSLGSNKVFHCPKCGFQCDRDVNGARNILIRFLVLNGISVTTLTAKLRVTELSSQ